MSESMKPLVDKLAGVMKSIGRVQKRGRNTQGTGYNYATEADVAEEVRGLLAEAGLILIPSVKSLTFREIQSNAGKPLHIATVMMDFTFTDGEHSLTYSMVGEGMDSGDKNVYKAMTGAEKYALMKFFLIPTGDDPEKDDEKPARAPRQSAPQKAPQGPQEASGALGLDEDILWHADEIARLRGGHRAEYIEQASGFPGTDKVTKKPNGKTVSFSDPRDQKSEKWKSGTLEKLKKMLHDAKMANEEGAGDAAEWLTDGPQQGELRPKGAWGDGD